MAEEESRPGTTQQRSCLRRQDARILQTVGASDADGILMTVLGAALSAHEYHNTFDTGHVAEIVVRSACGASTTVGAGLES